MFINFINCDNVTSSTYLCKCLFSNVNLFRFISKFSKYEMFCKQANCLSYNCSIMKKSIIFFLLLAANLNVEILGCTEDIHIYKDTAGHKKIHSVTITCPNLSSIFNYNYTLENLNVRQTLICSNSTADDFPVLPKFSGITEIMLQYFHVFGIKPGAFKNLEKLNSLYLYSNKITQIPNFKLIGIGRLEILDLIRNNISQIDQVLDADKIFLGYNQIETINVPFGNVTLLSLFGNKLKIMKSSFFKYPERLEHLRLDYNEISTIDDDFFVNMTNLYYLDLNSNNLTQLHSNLFHNLKKLQSLWLSNNKIENLPNGIFNNLTNLKYLHIDGNKLTVLDEALLKPLSSLSRFTLRNNQISSWDVSHLKKHSPDLYLIYMNNNKWNCQSLIEIIENLEKQDITIADDETRNGDNVGGIACIK